jgi:hypothetical protein
MRPPRAPPALRANAIMVATERELREIRRRSRNMLGSIYLGAVRQTSARMFLFQKRKTRPEPGF